VFIRIQLNAEECSPDSKSGRAVGLPFATTAVAALQHAATKVRLAWHK